MQQFLSTDMAYPKAETVQVIEAGVLAGSTLGTACAQAGINRATFWRWCQDDPTIKERLELTAAVRDGIIEQSLHRKAREGDVQAQKLWLSKRNPAEWGDSENGTKITNVVVNQRAEGQPASVADVLAQLSPQDRLRGVVGIRLSERIPSRLLNGDEEEATRFADAITLVFPAGPLDAADAVTAIDDACVGVVEHGG